MMASFFEQVHLVVGCIPPGKVATYGQIARLLGAPHAARTVGWALRAVPDDQDLPWHRVINARGTISLGAGGHGAAIQQVLLQGEGVVFDEQGRIDLKVYGWRGLDPIEREELLGDPA